MEGMLLKKFEAVELRDKNSEIYGGKSVMVAVNNVNKISIVRIYEKNLTIYVLLATERKLKK